MEDLKTKAEAVRWESDAREEEFILFSRSGFESGLRNELGSEWHLYDLERLAKVFTDGQGECTGT